jgi:hypothetical protein
MLIRKKYLELITFLSTSLRSILSQKVTWYRTKLNSMSYATWKSDGNLKMIKERSSENVLLGMA